MTRKISFVQVMALCAMAAALTGCASGGGDRTSAMTAPGGGRNLVLETPGQKALQCVPYARDNSDVKIYGDAWTWWDKAAGKYMQGSTPQSGAVLVLAGYAGPQKGHVAVVRQIVSPREIRVDHANWLNDGSVYLNNPVQDVSPANDWSQVRVYNIPSSSWGTKIYPVRGFIGGAGAAPDNTADILMADRGMAPPADEEWAEEPGQVSASTESADRLANFINAN